MTTYGIWRDNAIQKRLTSGQPFTLDGNQYPGNWLDRIPAAVRNALGVYPVVYTNVKSDQLFYTSVEGAPSVVSNDIRITWTNTLRSVAVCGANKLSVLRSRSAQAGANGVTVGVKRYATDRDSLLYVRSAIQDVLNNNATTSYIWAVDGSPTQITSANVNAARNALAAFFNAVSVREKDLYDQIQALISGNDAAGIAALDLDTGWPP